MSDDCEEIIDDILNNKTVSITKYVENCSFNNINWYYDLFLC